MNRKSLFPSAHCQTSPQNFYSILQQQSSRNAPAIETDELSKLLRQGKQLLYIDINEQKGFRFMQPCSSSQPPEDSLHLGHSYITNLQNLSESSAKAVSFLLQLKQDGSRKERSSRLMDQELRNKRAKLRQVGRSILQRQKLEPTSKPIVYRGMSSQAVQELMLSSQYEQTQTQLQRRQNELLRHYGIPVQVYAKSPQTKEMPAKAATGQKFKT